MGNEMGNNNVSGIQEDEKARSEEAQGKLSKEEISANELNGENHKEPEAEEKKLYQKQNFDEKEDTITKREDNTSSPGDFNEVVFGSETLLVAAGPQVENETSDEKDENDIESKPLSRALEIPAESNDAPDVGVGVQIFAASDISDLYARGAENHDKTDLDVITENEHHIEKEITSGRENNETDSPTIDSNARSRNLDLNSDQHGVHSEEDGCGSGVSQGESKESVGLSALAQSENSHLVISEMAEKMHLCVIPEDGENLLVKANVSEKETCQRTSDEAKVCDGDESPLDALQSPPEAPTEEASDPQLDASKSPEEVSEMPFLPAMNSPVETLEPPQEASKSPVEASEVPLVESKSSSMHTLEPPQEASESPVELSNLQLGALTSLESSGPPLEAFKSALATFKSPMEDTDSPLGSSGPPVQAVMLLEI